MKYITRMLGVSLLLVTLMLGACSNETPVSPVIDAETSHWTASQDLFGKQTYTVLSATLHLYAVITNPSPVTVHRITADWDETSVTWESFGAQYDPVVQGSFMVDVLGGRSVDVTDLVAEWMADIHPNYGFLLDQDELAIPRSRFYSREAAHSNPWLEISIQTAGEIVEHTLPAIADAYIWEGGPNQNFGSSIYLEAGRPFAGQPDKQILIRFELPEIPDEPGEGCTLTPGYWKTHSEFGPAPYDPTWALLPEGASTAFFLSGQTYHQVLWTPPAGGNAYYILSHAYIAAELNALNGADFADAQEAFDDATEVFSTYTPAQVRSMRGAQRNAIIALAAVLDDYNNGLIGPGHCDNRDHGSVAVRAIGIMH